MTVKRVYVMTEGTYPYQVGGVSMWLKQLLDHLSDIHFDVDAVVSHPWIPLEYPPLSHVSVRPVILWGHQRHDEYFPYLSHGSCRQNIVVAAGEALLQWLKQLLFPLNTTEHFLNINDLMVVYQFAQKYSLTALFRHRTIINQFIALCQHNVPDAVSFEAISTFWSQLYHFFLPLSLPYPTDMACYHLTVAGIGAIGPIVAAHTADIPVVVTEHGMYLRERYLDLNTSSGTSPGGLRYLQLLFYLSLTKWIYANAALITSVTHFNRRWVNAIMGHSVDVRVIPNGIETEKFSPLPDISGEILRREHHPIEIVHIGRLDPLKDQETLIRAMAILREQTSRPLILHLYGKASSEDYHHRLQSLIRTFQLDNCVFLDGHTSAVSSVLQRADIAVMSSRSEGLPLGILEAMCTGIPIVSTSAGGVPDLLQAPYGVMVPVAHPGALAEGLRHFVNMTTAERFKCGIQGRSVALAHFSLNQMLQSYRGIYEEMENRHAVKNLPVTIDRPAEHSGL